jgi:hypothetical protein
MATRYLYCGNAANIQFDINKYDIKVTVQRHSGIGLFKAEGGSNSRRDISCSAFKRLKHTKFYGGLSRYDKLQHSMLEISSFLISYPDK